VKKFKQIDMAKQRIKILLNYAIKYYKINKQFSKNCVYHAFKIKTRFNLKFPKNFRNLYCKRCFNLLLPPEGARIRIEGKGKKIKIITTCLDCGKIIRKEVERKIY
jgi:RNase P subunit RPR2